MKSSLPENQEYMHTKSHFQLQIIHLYFSSFFISQAWSQDLSNPTIVWGQREWERALFSNTGGVSTQVTRGNEVIDRMGLVSNKLP